MKRPCSALLAMVVLSVGTFIMATPAFAASDANADQLFETALAAYKMERWEDCSTKFYDFMAATPNDPRNDQAQYCVGRSYVHRKFLNKAIEEFGYLIQDFPNSQYTTLGLYYRAICYRETRQEDKAIEDFERVTKIPVKIYHGEEDAMLRQLYENHRDSVFWLAKRYLEKKQPELAVAVYQRLPYTIEAFRCVVNVYYDLGKYDTIRDMIDTLEGSNKHEAYKFLIEFYGKSKAYNQLKGVFAKLLEEKNANDQTDDLVRTTAWSFNNFGKEQWDWAMRRVSTNYPRMARWAEFELIKHTWENAALIDELELFIVKYRNGPDVDQTIRLKGIVLERQSKVEEARSNYRRISDPGLGHWYAAETFDGQHARTKDFEGALKEYENLRKAFYSPEWSAMAQWRIGEILRHLKRVDDAVEAYRQVIKRFGTLTVKDKWVGQNHYDRMRMPDREYGPAAQLVIGDILREAGRYDDSIMEYRIVMSKYRKSEEAPWAGYNTGLSYEGKEDPETAVKVFKSVLRRYGKSRAAAEAHTRLEQKYKIPDTEVSDSTDFFGDTDVEGPDTKNFIEDPSKMRDKNRQ